MTKKESKKWDKDLDLNKLGFNILFENTIQEIHIVSGTYKPQKTSNPLLFLGRERAKLLACPRGRQLSQHTITVLISRMLSQELGSSKGKLASKETLLITLQEVLTRDPFFFFFFFLVPSHLLFPLGKIVQILHNNSKLRTTKGVFSPFVFFFQLLLMRLEIFICNVASL